jgi:hypothetical protein
LFFMLGHKNLNPNYLKAQSTPKQCQAVSKPKLHQTKLKLFQGPNYLK